MPDKIYNVRVVTRAKQNRVEQVSTNRLKVWLTAPPIDNKANFLLLEVVAKYLNIKQRQISIIKGVKYKDKQIIVENS